MKIHLKRNGTALIILAVVNFFFELYAFYYLSSESSGWSFGIQNISGILLANLLCIAVGVIALIESENTAIWLVFIMQDSSLFFLFR